MLEKPPSKVQFTAFKTWSTTYLRIGRRRLIPHRRFRARRPRPHFLSILLKRGVAIQDAESCFRSDTRLWLAQLSEDKSYPFRLQSSTFGIFSDSYFQLFNVKGSSATKIAVSPDFRKFATLDDAGIVYNLMDMSLVQWALDTDYWGIHEREYAISSVLQNTNN